MSTGRLAFIASAAAILLSRAVSAQAEQPLTFCVAAHSLPLSASHAPGGIDVDVAKAIGARLGRDITFVWLGSEEESPEAALHAKRCDAAMGAIVDPGEMAERAHVPGLALTSPYYSAGYLIIHRPNTRSPVTLAEVGEARIGVEMVSIPIYTLKQRGHKVYALDDTEAVVRAVTDGRVAYGYVWGPAVAWMVRDSLDVVLAKAFVPVDRWDFAIAVRKDDLATLQGLNAAIHQMLASGEISRIFAKYKVPYILPTRGGADSPDAGPAAASRHAPLQRNPDR